MQRLLMFVFVIDFVQQISSINGVHAWKPIAGTHHTGGGGGTYKTTSFSLKQSHPGGSELIGTKAQLPSSYSQFEDGSKGNHAYGNDNDSDSNSSDDDVEAAALLSSDEDYYLRHHRPVARPITFETDDHYHSYSVLKGNEDIDLLNTHTAATTGAGTSFGSDSCSVKKFAFNHDGIVAYKNDLPEMSQFTMCLWMRFTNHSGDHVLLTYAVEKEPREIQIWVSNAKNSSFLSMAIKGQQMYRLNYPLRMRQWHHMCSSWNGKTGEWQVWLSAERIGRGFHNSLVGHKIPANGKLSSGGPSVTGDVSEGLHFEITLVQVYRVALSAGKAHRDHKHHHAHHFDHEGQEVSTTTKPIPTINRPQPQHSLLASGQIPTRLRINLANQAQKPGLIDVGDINDDDSSATNAVQLQQQQHQQPQHQAVTINTNFVNGQINVGSRLVTQQLLRLPSVASSFIRKPIVAAVPASVVQLPTPEFDMLSNSANVQFVDETETRIKFKREAAAAAATLKSSSSLSGLQIKSIKRKNNGGENRVKHINKRGLVLLEDGSLVDDGLQQQQQQPQQQSQQQYNGLAEFGGQEFKTELDAKMQLEDDISEHDREPAEEEVKAVMELCAKCDPEPFQGAIVFAWKNVHERMDNALKGLSVGRCGNF